MDNIIHELKHDLYNNNFKGSIDADVANRIINSTDNSIYELLPQLIVAPYNSDDVELLISTLNLTQFRSLSITARGGGTGTNGQSLTNGIVIDFSKYMTRIISYDDINCTVTVEPGVILANLNQYLKKYDVFFAPNISTANRATIGGMVATDAAGKGSLIYGKTSDHIVNMHFILMNGQRIDTQVDDALEIFKPIISFLNNQDIQQEISKCFKPLSRLLSGYNIKECYQDNSLNLNKLIAGSEGTLGIITQITLKVLPIPKHKTLVAIHYDNLIDAVSDSEFLLSYYPNTIEVVDEKIQSFANSHPSMRDLNKVLLLKDDDKVVSNFVEFIEYDKIILESKTNKFKIALDSRGARYVVINEYDVINKLWSLRSLAVGLAAKINVQAPAVAFVEDAIIPPKHLKNFIREFQLILDNRQLNYAMYGHLDVGCIHVRPGLNLQLESDRKLIRLITEEVFGLVNKYDGLLWGEHGKGIRGEYVERTFGKKLYPILKQIKYIFDPFNRLNPHKLVSNDSVWKIDEVLMRGELDSKIPLEIQKSYNNAMICNGNGTCFNKEDVNVMCPSYKVTNERKHSPKGRAMLVKEWLRALTKNDLQHSKKIAKLAKEALDGCLGCKGCTGLCPTNVSIPDIKSQFYYDYYKVYNKRSFNNFISAYLEHILLYFSTIPIIWNIFVKYFTKNNLFSTVFGFVDLPVFSSTGYLKKELERLNVPLYTEKTNFSEENVVVIFAEIFTGFLDKNVLFATISVFKKMGYNPYVIYPRPSGKALITNGFIEEFKKVASINSNLIKKLNKKNIPVICLENTITIMFNEEYKKFANQTIKVFSLSEFLCLDVYGLLEKFNKQQTSVHSLNLLLHCTEQSLKIEEAKFWQNIFEKILNTKLDFKRLGCCGMAGTYGHEKRHFSNSRRLFKMHWEDTVNDKSYECLVAGYSCRVQIRRLNNISFRHPIEFIDLAL